MILYWYLRTKKLEKRLDTREKLDIYQRRKISQHINWVKQHSPYIRKHYQDKYLLSDFPIMDKSLFMEQFTEWNTKGIMEKEAEEVAQKAEEQRNFAPKVRGVTVGLSSGTSGSRGMFLVSDQEREQWTGVILAKLLPKSLLHPEKIAFFLRANSNLYESTGQRKLQFKFFDLYELSRSECNELQALHSYSPSILIAPPSVLRLIAQEMEQGKIRIAPKKVISIAEVLEDIDKDMLVRVFKQQIHQVYQCTEGFLASTCKYGNLHLNEEHVVIEKEYLKDRRFVPIITDFTRTTQPIIRYRLNDILMEKGKICPCGSPATWIERIEGRCDDVFVFEKLDGEKLTIYPDSFRKLFYSEPTVAEYEVILTKNGLSIHLLPDISEEVKMHLHTQLRELFVRSNCPVPSVTWGEVKKKRFMTKQKRILNETSKCVYQATTG